MPSKSIITYDTIPDPYDNYLRREDGQADQSLAPDQTWGATNVPVGDTLNDLWIDTWIKSRSYQPGVQGFMLDAKKGSIEANLGLFRNVHIKMPYESPATATSPGVDFNLNDYISTQAGGTGINRVKINENGILLRNKTTNGSFTIGTTALSFDDFLSDGHFGQILVTDNTSAAPTSFNPGSVHPENMFLIDLINPSVDPNDLTGNKFVIQSDSQFGKNYTDRLFTVSNRQVYAARRLFLTDSLLGPTQPVTGGKIYFGYPTFPSTYGVEVINYMAGSVYFKTTMTFSANNTVAAVIPDTDIKIDLGSAAKRWNNIYTNNLTVSSTLSMSTLSVTTLGAVFITAQSIQLIGASVLMIGGFNFTPQTLHYKDWAGTNQTIYVLAHY